MSSRFSTPGAPAFRAGWLFFLLSAMVLTASALAQPVPTGDAGAPLNVETEESGGGARLLAIPEHDTFESIALADWMLRLAYFVAVLLTAGFAAVLPFVPWLIRVRGIQRAVYLVYSLVVRTYFLFRHTLWSFRWVMLAVFVVLLCLLFVFFLSFGTEKMLE